MPYSTSSSCPLNCSLCRMGAVSCATMNMLYKLQFMRLRCFETVVNQLLHLFPALRTTSVNYKSMPEFHSRLFFSSVSLHLAWIMSATNFVRLSFKLDSMHYGSRYYCGVVLLLQFAVPLAESRNTCVLYIANLWETGWDVILVYIQ